MISRKQLEEVAATVQGVPVWGCLPGSTSAEAGVRYGDIVLEVNGMRTPGIDEYIIARALRQDGIELRVFRAGSELTFFVQLRPPTDTLEALTAQMADGRYVATADSDRAAPKGLPS